MSSFREELISRDACSEAVEWVGDMSGDEAWSVCADPAWMLWLLRRSSISAEDRATLAGALGRLDDVSFDGIDKRVARLVFHVSERTVCDIIRNVVPKCPRLTE